MSNKTKRPRGRPPVGSAFPHLIHVRVPDPLKDGLAIIAASRADGPTEAALIRLAIAEFVDRELAKLKGKK